MDSRGVVGRRSAADSAFAADEPADPYDDRHRQTKALVQWERQRAAWARMQTHLASATAPTAASAAAHGHGGQRHAHSQRPSTLQSTASACAPEATLAAVTAAPNFAGATSAARARREDLGLLAVARADTTVDGSHAWEGQLRSTDVELVRRLVPIGRTSFPYQLYSEVRDPTTLPIDHMTYTRVVSEGDVPVDAVHEVTRHRAAAQSRVRAALTNAVAAASSADTASVAADGEEKEAMRYYEDQLTRLTPYVQERLGHFLQPRAFLQVEGQPAPYATAEEAEAHEGKWTGEGRASSAPPVEYFPPPPPPQSQMWPSMPTSMVSSRATSNLRPGGVASAPPHRGKRGSVGTAASAILNASPSTTPHGRHDDNSTTVAGGDGDAAGGGRRNEYAPRGSLATVNPSEMAPDEAGAGGENAHSADTAVGAGGAAVGGKRRPRSHSPTTSMLHPMQVDAEDPSAGRPHFFGDDADGGGAATAGGSVTRGPAMELSTRDLFFETRPHELLQGTVTLRNTGTTTIYYSWVAVDPVAEQLRQLPEDAAGREGGSLTEDTLRTEPREDSTGERPLSASQSETVHGTEGTEAAAAAAAAAARITHALAAHQRAARENFFVLSSPLSGVVLPGEEGTFAFSVRATRVGLFQHTFELLTVPPAPERIFVRMRALVERDGPSWDWLAAPVAQAIEAKVVLDMQRRLVQQISANDVAIEGAALLAHIEHLDGAADAAKAAERSRRRTQEDAWNLANRLSFDRIPYAACVYDKLDALYSAVQQTCWTLSHSKDTKLVAAEGGKTAAAGSAAGAGASPAALSGAQAGATPGPATSTASTTPASSTEPARGRGAAAAAAAANATSPAPVPPPQASEAAPASATAGSEPPALSAASYPARWDGSLLLLLQQMMGVRDAATRQVFFDAFLVLLRTARAVQPNSSGSHGEPALDRDSVPLPVLLERAAANLADGVRNRRAALLNRECENLLGQKPGPSGTTSFAQAFTAACVSAAAAAAAAATSQAAPGTAGGSPQSGNSTSAGTSKKSAVSSRGKSGVAAPAVTAVASMSERLDGRAGSGAATAAAEMSRAQRAVLDAVPAEELLGFSATHVPPKTVTALEAAEEAAVCARREVELSAERGASVAQYTSLFLEVIDAACDRGPLSSCSAARLAELEDIQTSALLPVDISADPVIPLTTGKGGKRK